MREGMVGKEERMTGGRTGWEEGGEEEELEGGRLEEREGHMWHAAACIWHLPDVALQPLPCAGTS